MLADTVRELTAVFRGEVHDDKAYSVDDDTGCLWSDAEILRYATEACDALATRAFGLVEVITIGFAAGATYVPLPARLLHINDARLVTADSHVEIVNSDTNFKSRSATGQPCEAYRDYDRNRLRLSPVPVAADSLEMSCAVTIGEALVMEDDVPFTKAEDQRLVLEYMKSIAYRKQDAETEDLVRAKTAEAKFEYGVEERASSLRNQRRAPGLIQMEW